MKIGLELIDLEIRVNHAIRLFMYLFTIYTVHVHMNTFEFIKQRAQYSRLAENRQYAYTSSETIIIKLKLL